MADQNNLPEVEDTKTRVTAKISPDAPGKQAPQIDLNTSQDKSPVNTMTGRTVKLQGLAGMAPVKPAVTTAPAAAPAPAASGDTTTKRTVKLASLAAGPSIKTMDLSKPQATPAPAPAAAPAPAPAVKAPAPAASTVTRRTQKLEALDTQDVVAMTETAPSAADDTQTRKASKISAIAAQPAPQAINLAGARQTVKVPGLAPTVAPAASGPATVQLAGVAPATQSPVHPVDDVPQTIQVPGVAPATQSPVRPVEDAPSTIQIAAPADDTQTRAAKKVEPAPAQFKAGNVDDTVKLQRPAPKPVMPGSVAPATQGGSPAAGGIKLNKPKPAAPKPAPAPAPVKEEKPEAEAEPEAAKPAEPTGNLGKDQTPPKKKKGLKVNTDAIKDLGSSPAAAAAGAPQTVLGGGAMPVKQVKESVGINVTFAIFGVMALLLMVFVALVATTDYLNIWQNKSTERIELPIISEQIYGKLNQK